jgi:hypothetical protein
MNPTQPPYLTQNQPLIRQTDPLVRQPDSFTRAEDLNSCLCLLLLATWFLGHSFTMLVFGLAFGGAWWLGIITEDAKQYRFYLATALVTLAFCSYICIQFFR